MPFPNDSNTSGSKKPSHQSDDLLAESRNAGEALGQKNPLIKATTYWQKAAMREKACARLSQAALEALRDPDVGGRRGDLGDHLTAVVVGADREEEDPRCEFKLL